jgi:hypothetical protein
VVSQRRINARAALDCTGREVKRRVWPRREIAPVINHPVNTALRIAVLHLNCSGPAGALSVTVNPGGANGRAA